MLQPCARYVPIFLIAAITALPLSSHGQATDSHAPPNTSHTKRIEGTIVRVDGNELLLRVAGGTTETYQLSPAAQLARSRPDGMADLTTGTFVGCVNLYGQSDRKVASECSILPDGLHALVTHRADEPSAESSWISGTITDVRDATDAQAASHSIRIRITDRNQATDMLVTPVTKVTVLSSADASALQPGVKARAVSQQAVDGTGVIQTLTVVSGVQ
jgi:hypothetical protein